MSKFVSPIERADARLKELEGTTDEQQGQTNEQEGHTGEGSSSQNAELEGNQQPSQGQEGDKGQHQQEDENSETYKQRWTALQGLLNGERQKVSQLTHQVETLSQQVQKLSAEQAKPAQAAMSPEQLAAHLKFLQEEYGDEYLTAMRGTIRGEAAQVVSEMLDQRLKPVEEKFDAAQAQSEEERRARFYEALEGRVNGWEPLFNSEKFQTWLDTPETLTGATYRALMNDANVKWDMNRIVGIFNTFKQATGTAQPSGATQQGDPREGMISPGRGSATGQGQRTNQPKIYNLSEVQQFYRDVNAGRWRGREAEVAQIEADIDRANIEGRIR